MASHVFHLLSIEQPGTAKEHRSEHNTLSIALATVRGGENRGRLFTVRRVSLHHSGRRSWRGGAFMALAGGIVTAL